MKNIILIIIVLFTPAMAISGSYKVSSPDGKISVLVKTDKITTYEVYLNEKVIIGPSPISMTFSNGLVIGEQFGIKNAATRFVSENVFPEIPRKYAEIKDEFNQLTLTGKDQYSLLFRVYNDGVAYRWQTDFKEDLIVEKEQATFIFNENAAIFFPEEQSMFSHQERLYLPLKLSDISAERFCSTGTLVQMYDNTKVFISESDLEDYPGMFLQGMDSLTFGLQGKFAAYPLQTNQINDRSVLVTEYADYIAKTTGSRSFPWRVLIITNNDAELIESEMIWKLAKPNQLSDVTWIKPGKVAWDWWNALNIYGVDFQAGLNTDTYKYYIDFAHDYQLEYIILDEGWYYLDDVLKVKEEIDLDEIISYGAEKNVGVILWVTWKALDDQLDNALDTFQEWGVKGIKVDFMQRDDQWMVNYYYKIAKEAAKRKLLVDFHGAYKPTGLHRTYPNVLTSEGVAGLEQSKWSEKASPEHDLMLPFIRMVSGPMDYTPGAMLNAGKENFKAIFNQPMSQGTRCHQLAMYVVFESPLQMLADSPSHYKKENEIMKFLAAVPTTWEDTKVIEARFSDYVMIARKNKNKWFVGAMTDWTSRELLLTTDFLPEGVYQIEIWQDGPNADKNAMDFKRQSLKIKNQSQIPVRMAAGGGWVAIISEKDK